MPVRPSLTAEKKILIARTEPSSLQDAWDGRCPGCGGTAELTSYLGNDDMRSEEHWWCAKCMLGLNVQVVRIVARATSVRPTKDDDGSS